MDDNELLKNFKRMKHTMVQKEHREADKKRYLEKDGGTDAQKAKDKAEKDAAAAAGSQQHWEPIVRTGSGVRFAYWTWKKE